MGPSAEDHVPETVRRIHGCLTANAKLILLAWLVAFLAGGMSASYFINKAEDRLSAPFHSRVGKLFIFR